ncbi:MAG: bifunctional UDP-N-acetylglucosamine diphosphorylase/glucosamine-1-phosphate N-acetyltransferase GlmU [Zoogloeaceae bacterium]|jgi:bifunctional UDP-N-acetylglucosamine pyrophosphorylase/glucosamine-1-phosphate N-acetyltransferase|nr:bifunctional UDP-N-acetylglucosamine diphosphorylase/glucosamine-1-phosphate N-acetyltransferase GlmU [Zoogloeaceae bacterium]
MRMACASLPESALPDETPRNIVILAAGQGKRMRASLPKVLHPLGGKPMLQHVLETARALRPRHLVVVYGHGGEAVRAAWQAENDLLWVLQAPQLGTGHALRKTLPCLDPALPTLVLYGDVPLVSPATLRALLAEAREGLALLTARLPDPRGYGRIVRDQAGKIRAIVEEKDASEAERRIDEINTGIMALPATAPWRWLAALSSRNAQGEYYLTDVVAQAVAEGVPVRSAAPAHLWEIEGVNDKAQLARLERIHQRHRAQSLMEAGAHLLDPERIDIRGDLVCGQDVRIDVGVVFEGRVVLEDGVTVGPYCVIRDAVIHAGARIAAFSHIDGARVGAHAVVGPYARLRPGAELGEHAHVGNFVEIKQSRLGAHSKANHLAYVGDAEVGQRVNIGAGVITCNYDGVNKSRTVIEDDAFIGSDSQLVAPVRVGRGATLGAGTTLTRDAPPEALTVSRPRQTTLPAWKRPQKETDQT